MHPTQTLANLFHDPPRTWRLRGDPHLWRDMQATLSSSAALTIRASAEDADGKVTNVQFFDGTVALGNDTDGPYLVSVSAHLRTLASNQVISSVTLRSR